MSRIISVACLLFAISLRCPLPAAELNDGIDRTAPDFIKASLLIMGPGEELFACVGHACFRMECPSFNLDLCYSYESESVRDKVLTFFRGKLKMGMFSVPTQEFLKEYEATGRGVTQYTLRLSPEVEQKLWRVLDARVAEGPNRPYDYVDRGCALSVFECLEAAFDPVKIPIDNSDGRYDKTLRELFARQADRHPWNRLFAQAIMGTAMDADRPKERKVALPQDLVDTLANSTPMSMSQSLLDKEGTVLLPSRADGRTGWISPMVLAGLLLLVSVVLLMSNYKALDLLFAGLMAAVGAVPTFLVVCSSLPATDWNWLIVPFSALPLVLWKWRRKWAAYYAGLVLLSCCAVLVYPHELTDSAFIVLAFAQVVFYIKFTKKFQQIRERLRG